MADPNTLPTPKRRGRPPGSKDTKPRKPGGGVPAAPVAAEDVSPVPELFPVKKGDPEWSLNQRPSSEWPTQPAPSSPTHVGWDGRTKVPEGEFGTGAPGQPEVPSVKVPEEYLDPLAKLVRARFERARRWRMQQRLGNYTVDAVLRHCWEQVEGIMDPGLAEIIEATGVDLNLNLSLLKVEAFEAWGRSIITDQIEMPWTVDPTEIPTLSDAMRQDVLMQVKEQLFNEMAEMPQDLPGLIKRIKAMTLEREIKEAQRRAKNMERLMKDQAQEGGFKTAMLGLLRDFATYPYCVMEGPVPVVRTQMVWRGSRVVPERRTILDWRRRSPFDLYWSSDSQSVQKGSYVVLRDRMTRSNLMEAARARSYIGRNVVAALEHFTRSSTRDWLNPNPERQPNLMWPAEESIEVLTMYGLLSADELRPYGLQVYDGHFYECRVKILGPYTIMVQVLPNPAPFSRPVHTAAMSCNGERITGIGLCQKLRDVERAYHSTLRDLVRNSHYSSGPIGEVDYSRVQRWLADEELGTFDPFTIMPVDPDVAGGGRPAHYFHNTPNVAAALINTMEFFERVADRVSQIPAAFHGEAVGSGVNRTFRGVSLLQGNALKGVQAALTNFGEGVIQPAALTQWRWNMMYSDDESVKGDCNVVLRDIGGLLEREIKKQSTLETLQMVAQLRQAGAAPQAALSWAGHEALVAAGVPMDKIEDRLEGALQGMPEGAMPAGEPGAPGGPPTMPPGGGVAAPQMS